MLSVKKMAASMSSRTVTAARSVWNKYGVLQKPRNSAGVTAEIQVLRCSSAAGGAVLESTDEFHYVQRIIPPSQIPAPPKHTGVTPSGWSPPAESPPSLPYFIRRSRMHNVPVYSDIKHGNQRSTLVRRVEGDIWVQGLIISQMLRKSVETRDWVNTIEPRNVRAVMKRVVEDTTAIDVQVGLLYEEGVRKAHSSDSSKRTFSVYSSSRQQIRYAPSYTPSAPMDTNLLSNIHKLFSERIDIFSPVEFNKVSVLTGIVKISLKSLVECVRVRSFGRFGLQQVQVDCHYLQMYLWRFVSDENLVHFLLDEIVSSTAHRCIEPIPMEQSVIELICERG